MAEEKNRCQIIRQMYMFVSFNSSTTGVTIGAENDPSEAPEFTPGFQWRSCCSFFSFLCRVLQISVCPFSFGHCLVCPSYVYTSDYPFGIFKPYLGAPEFLVGFVCMFCRSLFVLLYFFLLAIVLSVLLRYKDSDYPFIWYLQTSIPI